MSHLIKIYAVYKIQLFSSLVLNELKASKDDLRVLKNTLRHCAVNRSLSNKTDTYYMTRYYFFSFDNTDILLSKQTFL